MQSELLENSSRELGASTLPQRVAVLWVRIALSGLLVAGPVLMSSWLFRG